MSLEDIIGFYKNLEKYEKYKTILVCVYISLVLQDLLLLNLYTIDQIQDKNIELKIWRTITYLVSFAWFITS